MEVFKKSGVTMWECRNCGHIVVGPEAPAVCTVCNHPGSHFEVRKLLIIKKKQKKRSDITSGRLIILFGFSVINSKVCVNGF